MATSKPFVLAFTILFLSACMHAGAQSTFSFKNNCPFTVWPGTLTGDVRKPQLSQTGFELASGASSSLNAPASWSGRFWARTQCQTDSTGKFVCNTADCGSGTMECKGAGAIPPASLAEFTLNGDGGKDFYDVSLVDGFNLPLSITPQGGACSSTSCPANVNAVCDPALAVKGSDGTVIACKSACVAFNQPQFCCTGEFNNPDKCKPSSYSLAFKQQCPQAYTYAYDDKSSTFTCASGLNYLITFCP